MTFPDNPTAGQTFKPTPTFPVTYTWTGYSWKALGSAAGRNSRGMVLSDNPPAKADSTPGDFWIERSTGYLYAFIDDGNDCHWVQIS